MPATEQTWRNQKTMHIVFAVSGVILLISTLWMFAADHSREWKGYQTTYREIEQVYNQLRQQEFQVADAVSERAKLQAMLLAAQSAPIKKSALEEFKGKLKYDADVRDTKPTSMTAIESMVTDLNDIAGKIESASGDEATGLRKNAKALRERILSRMQGMITSARFREDRDSRTRKAQLSQYDKSRADLGLMVSANASTAAMEAQQKAIRKIKEGGGGVDEITASYQHANTHRQALEKVVKSIVDDAEKVTKSIQENGKALTQLKTAFVDRRASYFTGAFPFLGKKWLELPILDAFNSPLKIDNLWSEGLMQNYNFADVRRFDRCTTCHRGIEKSLPGQATKEGYPAARKIELRIVMTPLPSVEDAPATKAGGGGSATTSAAKKPVPHARFDRELANAENPDAPTAVEKYFGFKIAKNGVINKEDVLVSYVRPQSRAAQAEFASKDASKVNGLELRKRQLQTHGKVGRADVAGIMVGDVITQINGDDVSRSDRTLRKLADSIAVGESITIQVRRGMPHPYASHPRLDLFVGSLSPHKVSDFACTICHEGQGSATAFKWASHSPNTEPKRKEWVRKYGWFDNHHWIYPQLPKRFIESTCLKCHHDVTELEASKRFPDAPAPKVTRGFHLVRKFGCFGCHEINGYDGPDKRVGPDLRLEPNYFAAAQHLRSVKGYDKLSGGEKRLVQSVIDHPQKNPARRRLRSLLLTDKDSKQPRLADEAHGRLASILKDVESPGRLRKVGPSLRFLGKKVDRQFLLDWITDPRHFRPGTRMPKFFGMHNHMSATSSDTGQKMEAIEVLAATTFLLAQSQDFTYAKRPSGITKSTTAEKLARGKVLFQTKGCLACHSHGKFKDVEKYRTKGEIVQGPDLSAIGNKFDPARNPNGRDWLYTWIQNPSKYHVRTKMPELILKPVVEREKPDKDGNLGKVIRVTDPVEDIVEYLLTSKTSWKPAAGLLTKVDAKHQSSFEALALENLANVFYTTTANDYLTRGIPETMRKELKGAEVELLVPVADYEAKKAISEKTKLMYLGRRTVAKYGCYACHDIPGFEDAKPIGTTLADWGRKEPSKLAFEHITHYLHGNSHGKGSKNKANGDHSKDGGHGNTHETPEFYLHQIESGHRAGFIYQKLVEPRSYDYHKTENKTYSEWLRMPQFPLDDEMREAILTFVLGLVAEPPAEKYMYRPKPVQKAIIEGKQVLAKYNCAGCHMLEPQKLHLTFKPDALAKRDKPSGFPFAIHEFAPDLLTSSRIPNNRNRIKTTLYGMPLLAKNDALAELSVIEDPEEPPEPILPDEDFDPTKLVYQFRLWKPAPIDGQSFQVGANLRIPHTIVTDRYDSQGGTLAKYLAPHVLALEKKALPTADGSQVWTLLPPTLLGEGSKVQTEWLFNFLLDPHEIRPATVLRMPRFNMSEEEATKLVNYFAALDGAQFPYSYKPRQRRPHLTAMENTYQNRIKLLKNKPTTRLYDSMKMVANTCAGCHSISDYAAKGRKSALAPNLADVYRRLRPSYVRRWIGSPKLILPYTAMPDNVAYDPSKPFLGTKINQKFFHGNSIQQLDGLVDVIMNFDAFTRGRVPITPMVPKGIKPPTTTPAAGGD